MTKNAEALSVPTGAHEFRATKVCRHFDSRRFLLGGFDWLSRKIRSKVDEVALYALTLLCRKTQIKLRNDEAFV
jgi:hypothetical protein